MLLNQTTVRYPLLSMCDPSNPAVDLLTMKNSFMLTSHNYPSPYPRGSSNSCSLNVTLSRGMQMHLALVDLDLVSTGVWPPPWQQRLLAYTVYLNTQQTVAKTGSRAHSMKRLSRPSPIRATAPASTTFFESHLPSLPILSSSKSLAI